MDVEKAMRRKNQLEKEIEDIKNAIEVLKRSPLYELLNERSEETEESKEIENNDILEHALLLTEIINKIRYTNVKLESLDDDVHEYEADATSGPVNYNFRFQLIISPEDKQPLIRNLKIIHYNDFIESELKSWQNKCVRDNSLQTFQRGIVSYAEMFSKREAVFVYFRKYAAEYFSLNKSVEEGKYIISAQDKSTDTQYFWCEWEITWNFATSSMINFFNLHVNNKEPFYNKNEPLFTELTSSTSNLTSDRVQEIWEAIAKGVIEESQRD